AVSPQWEDIGLGAITDFVQQAFGPVDFDRSLVELTATSVPLPGCPACAGGRFKFPADLADSQGRMCQAHQKEADALIKRRMARAAASNPARRAFFGGQAALALAEAGRADDARVKIAEQVERWPDDVQTRTLAGDALAVLGDAEAALAQYQAARPLAQQAKDYRATRELSV